VHRARVLQDAQMIEIAGSRTVLSFDGRVLELFSTRSSRRIHVDQILGAEVQPGRLMVGDAAVLELRLADGQELAVPFAAADWPRLEQLVDALPVRR
jgi:hypothetical protein